MNQQKIFEALRLKVKLSRIISEEKAAVLTRKDVIDTVKSCSDLLVEFENTGDDVEFKTILIDLCSNIIIMLDDFSVEQKRITTFQEALCGSYFDIPPLMPRYPNSGMVGPSAPSFFNALNHTGIKFNRKVSVNEIEKQLKETKYELDSNGAGAKK